jgi:hypothetical protein
MSSKKLLRAPPLQVLSEGKVLPHSDIPPSSIIMAAFYTAKITNLAAFYCCAKVAFQPTYQHGEAQSLRWRDCVKGRPGGCFNPKSAMFDIRGTTTHKHTKISHNSNIVSLCGVKTEAEGQWVASRVMSYIVDAQQYLETTRQPLFRQATRWLLAASKGEKCSHTRYVTIRRKEFGEVEVSETISDYTVQWPTKYPPEYSSTLTNFLERSDDLLQKRIYYSDLVDRIESICGFEDIYVSNYQLESVKVSSYIYFYNLGFLPDRTKLDHQLTRQGFDSYFNSTWGHYVVVTMITTQHLDLSKVHRKDTSGLQTFTFYPLGKVRHNGPGRESMAVCYHKLMTAIAGNISLLRISLPPKDSNESQANRPRTRHLRLCN